MKLRVFHCLRAGARLSLHSDMSLPSKLRSLKLIAHCTTSIRRDVNSHFRSHDNVSALGSLREEGGKPKVYLAGTGSALFEIVDRGVYSSHGSNDDDTVSKAILPVPSQGST